MKPRHAAYIIVGIIALHTFMSFLFTAPKRYVHPAVRPYAAAYIMPFFKQNWTLFAPKVPSDVYEISVVTDQGDTLNLISEFVDRHAGMMFYHDGRIALGLYNWCLYVDQEIWYQKEMDSTYRKGTPQVVHGILDHMDVRYDKVKYLVLRNEDIVYSEVIEKPD